MRKQKDILVITYAVPEELDAESLRMIASEKQSEWFNRNSTRLKRWWYDNFGIGQFDKECVIVETGIGKLNSATALQETIHQIECECGTNAKIWVFNVGTAASIKLPIGKIVKCSRYVDRDLISIGYGDKDDYSMHSVNGVLKRTVDVTKTDEEIGRKYQSGYSCNSGDSFVTDAENAYQKDDGYTAVCDMEAFAQAKVAFDNSWKFDGGINFLSVKYVTDQIGQENTIESWNEELPAARIELTKIAQMMIRKFFKHNVLKDPRKTIIM